MTTYRLTFQDDGLGARKYLEFEGDTPACALLHLQTERFGRRAGLSQGSKPIATLIRCTHTNDLWIVEPPIAELEQPPTSRL